MKKISTLTLVLLLLLSTALAAGGSLSLKASQPLDRQQFEAFRAYLDSLPAEDRAAWTAEMAAILRQEESASSRLSLAAIDGEALVWVSKTGKKYHSDSGCSGMKSPVQVSREEALRRGLAPCKRCKPQ